MKEQRRYLLTIKRDNNDYLPLEWNLTNFYNGENLYQLSGIDAFTKKMTRVELIDDILHKNMVDGSEKFMNFAIIYYEKGKNREVKEGTIFKEENYIFTEEEFILYILENLKNKKNLSLIYNMCNIKSDDKKLTEFKFILKNIDAFKIKGTKGVIAAISLFKDIDYDLKRKILIRTSDRISK